ncbi:MAG: hypothetical protein DDG60_02775 [Anaerolineae bacterium]|nr:MAG: hypothetical protein DDG60_02775 [Anaerolineae bacterium]
MQTVSPPSPSQTRLARTREAQRRSREAVLFSLLPVVFLLGLGLGWILWGDNQPSNTQQAAQSVPTMPVRRVAVEAGDSPALGPTDAPITIIEFSDYECPFCARWHQQVYQRLLKEYEGKIRFVYRDFPLESIHPNAKSAAIAAHCAGEQGAYFPFHDALFSYKYDLNRESYLIYATELGLDIQAFQTCVDEERYADKVQSDLRYGLSIGVNSTPTFFVNGIIIIGAQPFDVFQQVIEKELAGQ